MLYDYVCPVCNNIVEMSQDISDEHTAICDCGSIMHRNWKSVQIRPDEFKSVQHFDKVKGHYVQSHGDHYDAGLGAWVTSQSQRRDLMKAKGLHELEGEPPPVEALVKHQKDADKRAVGLPT